MDDDAYAYILVPSFSLKRRTSRRKEFVLIAQMLWLGNVKGLHIIVECGSRNEFPIIIYQA